MGYLSASSKSGNPVIPVPGVPRKSPGETFLIRESDANPCFEYNTFINRLHVRRPYRTCTVHLWIWNILYILHTME